MTDFNKTIATLHSPFVGLLRPFVIWVLTSAPLWLFEEQIMGFAEELLGNLDFMPDAIYWLGTITWTGGFFYFVVLGYLIDAVFYIRKMPRDIVLQTGSGIVLAKPMQVKNKGLRKKILKFQGSSKVTWINSKRLDPDDIWDEEDLIDEIALSFDDIELVWLNAYAKNIDKALANDKPVSGTLIVLTTGGMLYAQPIISDLRTLVPALNQLK
ncbi:MAG: hypothetical protein FWC86_02160 [Coriobacteriia bacterium]|nr:hypothetical protein [Coriobacteriia bacterium]